MRTLVWLIVVVMAVFTWMLTNTSGHDWPPPPTAPVAAPVAAKALPPPTAWDYGVRKDKMDGDESRYAQVKSLNVVTFEFPYQDADNRAILRLWQRDSKLDGIFLGVQKGHFTCHRDECGVRVKFDDAKPSIVMAMERGNGVYDWIILKAGPEFVEKLKKSKKLMIEAIFYRAGTRVMEFDVAGLVWP